MSKKEKNPRLGRVGGQAVLEGVMMRSGDEISLAVRREDGEIVSKNSKFTSVRKKHKFLNIPIIRGCVNFVEMMKLSFTTMTDSAKLLGLDDFGDETKFDRWIKRKFGEKVMNVIVGVASVFAVILALGLFVVLPMLITSWIKGLVGGDVTKWAYNFLFSLISGVIRIILFIVYMVLVSLMKDIKSIGMPCCNTIIHILCKTIVFSTNVTSPERMIHCSVFTPMNRSFYIITAIRMFHNIKLSTIWPSCSIIAHHPECRPHTVLISTKNSNPCFHFSVLKGFFSGCI